MFTISTASGKFKHAYRLTSFMLIALSGFIGLGMTNEVIIHRLDPDHDSIFKLDWVTSIQYKDDGFSVRVLGLAYPDKNKQLNIVKSLSDVDEMITLSGAPDSINNQEDARVTIYRLMSPVIVQQDESLLADSQIKEINNMLHNELIGQSGEQSVEMKKSMIVVEGDEWSYTAYVIARNLAIERRVYCGQINPFIVRSMSADIIVRSGVFSWEQLRSFSPYAHCY